MSYTNETTHYGIPLPLGTDKTTPMDYNESMQEIDTVLFGAKTDSDSALRKAQQVETGLSQTNDNLSSVAGRVTTLEGTSVTQGNAIQQNAQNIADVRADALDMIVAKDEGTAQVATVAVAKGEYFRYNDVLYIATQNIAVGNTIVPNTNCKATNVGTELNQLNNGLALRPIMKSKVVGNNSNISVPIPSQSAYLVITGGSGGHQRKVFIVYSWSDNFDIQYVGGADESDTDVVLTESENNLVISNNVSAGLYVTFICWRGTPIS